MIAGLISYFAVARLTMPGAWDTMFTILSAGGNHHIGLVVLVVRRRSGDYLGRLVAAIDRVTRRELEASRVVRFILDVESTGTPPGHGGTPPGHGGTPPGQADTPPDQATTDPADTSTPVTPPGTPPGHGGTPPGHGGTPPGQAGTPPGQSDEDPGRGPPPAPAEDPPPIIG